MTKNNETEYLRNTEIYKKAVQMGVPLGWINSCSTITDIGNLISLFLNKKIREELHSSEKHSSIEDFECELLNHLYIEILPMLLIIMRRNI